MEIVAGRVNLMRIPSRTTLLGPRSVLAASAAAALLLGGCSSPDDEGATPDTAPSAVQPPTAAATPLETSAAPSAPQETPADCPGLTRMTLTVPGTSAPRFAGYYAALSRDYYADACLDVAIITATSAAEALATLAGGTADAVVAPLAEGLRAREAGSAVVNVAQVFQRSGTVEVSFTSAGIDSPDGFRGKRVGLGSTGGWEVIAAASKAGLDPVADTTLVPGGGVDTLLAGEVDAAAVQTYDGYQRLLGQPQPDAGTPITPDDLNVIDYAADGVGLLPDGLWVGSDRLADGAGADAVQRFVTSSLRGWIDCRDDAAGCAALPDLAPGGDIELATRMVQAVNALVWPSPLGVGVIDPAQQSRTVQVALVTKDLDGGRLITREPDEQAITTAFATEADAQLTAQGLNVNG